MRSVRIDDFPHGDKASYEGCGHQYCLDRIAEVTEIFEEEGVPYILGVTPLLLQDGDVEFLNKHIKEYGRVVMHGFDHGFSAITPWHHIVHTWPHGGEFMNLSVDSLTSLYAICDTRLAQIARYDPTQFIPPFNCYTQELLDVLSVNGVKVIHTCDKEYQQFSYDSFNYHGMEVRISEFTKTYDHVDKVMENLVNPSQITLHWIYDVNRPNWQEEYRELCRRIKSV